MQTSANRLQPLADKTAITLSLLCALHCLALPLLLVVLPALSGLALADERFHLWLVLVVIPISAFALTLGCRRHRNGLVLLSGAGGLALLCLTPILGHDLLSESGERIATLVAAGLLAASHVRYYQLCQQGSPCECPD
jgi:hypothetical protein